MNRLVVALLILLDLSPAWAWVKIEEPPLSTVEWVAQDMVFNGIPMRMQTFHSKASANEVLAHYRQLWSPGGRRQYVENDLGPWRTISRQQDDFFITVQVRRAADGTEGYLSQRLFKIEAQPVATRRFDLPPGTKLVNDIVTRDSGRSARTVLAFNNLSVDDNAAFFRKQYTQAGWSIASDAKADDKRQMVLQRANEELSVAIASQPGGTAVAATQVSR